MRNRQLMLGLTTSAETAAALGISRTTYYRWRRAFAPAAASRVDALEHENARLRRILVDRELENDALRQLARRPW